MLRFKKVLSATKYTLRILKKNTTLKTTLFYLKDNNTKNREQKAFSEYDIF